MAEKASLLATVHGRVQGVYFRDFVQRQARSLGLTGYVKNLYDGRSVEVWAEGDREQIEKLVRLLHIGPDRAIVEAVDSEWAAYTGNFDQFNVRY